MDVVHLVAKVCVNCIGFLLQRKKPIHPEHQEVQCVLALPVVNKQILIISEH